MWWPLFYFANDPNKGKVAGAGVGRSEDDETARPDGSDKNMPKKNNHYAQTSIPHSFTRSAERY
jgi:hypothetical protein